MLGVIQDPISQNPRRGRPLECLNACVPRRREDGKVNAVESPNETCTFQGKIRCYRKGVRDSRVHCHFRRGNCTNFSRDNETTRSRYFAIIRLLY
jgi:hypothetical protein